MKEEAQRIAIAEACGWLSVYRCSRKGNAAKDGCTYWGSKDTDSINYPRIFEEVPDYLNDLNAMHEAEKVLQFSQQYEYASRLMQTMGLPRNDPDRSLEMIYKSIHATASQRAETFLRTIEKWKDESS